MERAAVRTSLKHLYARGRLECPGPGETDSGRDSYLRQYEAYLRNDRGLADNSVHVYLYPVVKEPTQSSWLPPKF
jgi:hypothetical protein